MGSKMGPSYANLFVGYIEHKFFNQYNGPKPGLYRRYIDDCVGATSSTREELNQFITAVNSFHPALKYTWEISDTSLAFLDIILSIEGNGLCTSVHYKPTHPFVVFIFTSITCQEWLVLKLGRGNGGTGNGERGMGNEESLKRGVSKRGNL